MPDTRQHLRRRHRPMDLGQSGHSVTSGPPCEADSQYCSPDDKNCASGNSFQHRHSLRTHLYRAWRLFVPSAPRTAFGMTGVVNVSGGCAPSGWSAGPDLPSVGQSGWRSFPSRRQLLRTWAVASRMRWGMISNVLHFNPTSQQLDSHGGDFA